MKGRLHNKSFKALIITLAVVLVLGVLSMGENSVVSSLINGCTKGLFQISSAAVSAVNTKSYEELESENEKLKAENAKLREQLADYYDIKNENERLWKFYELKKENPSYEILPASVIKRDANDDFYAFTLDVGSSLGVEVNDPVITENGLVGWVCRVDLSTCKVKTVLSPETKAGAIDRATNDGGIISGSTELCDKNQTAFTKIAENNKIKEGDMIVTSGTGGVYPKNLIIGEVKELKFNSYDTSIYAVVEPYEKISEITSASVITDFEGKGEVGGK